MSFDGVIGFVGLGAMGGPMVEHLANTGHALQIFDVIEQRRDELAGPETRAAPTAAAAADGVGVLAVMVATPEQLDAALFGRDGAAESLDEGSTVVVFATVGPDAVRTAAHRLAKRSIRLVDAPVSGGVARAGAGDLVIMVGGDPKPIQPLLDTLGSDIAVCGPNVGDGQTMKIVNQLVCGVHIAVTAEALAFAEALGVDPEQAYDVLSKGAAQSFMFVDRGPRMLSGDTTSYVGSALDIFVKDMGLVTQSGDQVGAHLPLGTAAHELFTLGHDLGFGRNDDAGVVEVYRHWAAEQSDG